MMASWENPKMHIWYNFGDSSSNHYKLTQRQAKLPSILSQNGQNDFKGQGQWPPFSIPAESIPGCMFGANLVILVQIYDELSRGQAEFPRILNQNGQNDLQGQDHTFFIMFPSSYHYEIFRSYYQWQKWCPCKKSRSKVKVTQVKTQLNRFWTITPVWIHQWLWNDVQSLK